MGCLLRDASAGAIRVSDLLRRTLALSRSLGVREIETWARSELNGYDAEEQSYPDYRMLDGVPVAVRGQTQIPLQFSDPTSERRFSRMPCILPVSELESLVASADARSQDSFIIPFLPDQDPARRQDSTFRGYLEVPKSKLVRVLDAVRTGIADWAVKLRDLGVDLDDDEFDDADRRNASGVVVKIKVQGDMVNSPLQIASPDGLQAVTFDSIDREATCKALEALRDDAVSLAIDLRSELEAEIATITAQLRSPNPKRGVLREAGRSLRAIIEGAAGSALVSTPRPEVEAFLAWAAGTIAG